VSATPPVEQHAAEVPKATDGRVRFFIIELHAESTLRALSPIALTATPHAVLLGVAKETGLCPAGEPLGEWNHRGMSVLEGPLCCADGVFPGGGSHRPRSHYPPAICTVFVYKVPLHTVRQDVIRPALKNLIPMPGRNEKEQHILPPSSP
jgi:hypothetical protein